MASELISLQAQVLSLQEEERDLDNTRRTLQEELARLEHVYAEDATKKTLAGNVVNYLDALASSVKSKQVPEGLVSIAGEIRVQLSAKEAIVLEVGTDTEFGDVIKEVLDYIGYPQTEVPSTEGTLDFPRVKLGSPPATEISMRVAASRSARPRSDFCLRDKHGAIFCNDNKVVETFASSAVLWMAYLSVRPDLRAAHFDPEEEITTFLQELDKVVLPSAPNPQSDAPDVGISERFKAVLSGQPQADFSVAYDRHAAARTAHLLLTQVRAQSSSSRTVVEDSFLGRSAKRLKKQTIEQANDRRNQSRRQGLLMDCVIHLVFVMLSFFTAFAYTSYTNTKPEYVSNIYFRDLEWDTGHFQTLEEFFEARIMPFKPTRLGSDWNVGEVRIRQLRVDCEPNSHCEKYRSPSDPQSLVGVSFNPEASDGSQDPDSFKYQLRNPNVPIIPLSNYLDSLALLTSYDATGGYFKFWPEQGIGQTVPPNFTDWIDQGTAFISVEFNIYEPNPNLLIAVKVIAQYPNYRTGLDPKDVNASDVCGIDFSNGLESVILVKTTNDLATMQSGWTTATILCGFALFAGGLSIIRGLNLLKISISGDRDIARAVEVYKPNAGLLRSAMTALSVAKSNRLFNPSDLSRFFWLLVDLTIVGLLITGLVYHYVVVQPAVEQLKAIARWSPLIPSSAPVPPGASSPSNYTEVYGPIRDTNTVIWLLAFASWLALFSGIRELRLISSGVLIGDTITQSILPQLLVLFVVGYAPLGIAFAAVGFVMFGYLDRAFQSLELSAYTVVSKDFFFDVVVSPAWRPLYSILIILYYMVTSAIAYAVVFEAYKRESSKLVKGPFTIMEILWPIPTIRSWIRQENKSDLWAGSTETKERKIEQKQQRRKIVFNKPSATMQESPQQGPDANAATAGPGTTVPATASSTQAIENTAPKSSMALSTAPVQPAFPGLPIINVPGQPEINAPESTNNYGPTSYPESLDMPEEGEDVSYRRTSILLADPAATEDGSQVQASSTRE